MRAVIAAITARAAPTVAAAAPAGVDVTVLPAAHEEAEFLVISDDPEVLEALPGLRAARVVQTLSAGTDWIEGRVPPWATLCNARGARDTAVAEWVIARAAGRAARAAPRRARPHVGRGARRRGRRDRPDAVDRRPRGRDGARRRPRLDRPRRGARGWRRSA